MATEPTNPFINRIFDGRYLIVRKLGSGGMAEVYLAEDQELGRKVALKMLNERHARDAQFVERFKREARNAAGLSHPHIVRIYDRGQAEGTYYIAMEYLDGPTLKELLIRKGPTPPLTAIKFAREILSALAEAHRNEIVHRDIKPHNVIVSPDWQIKVTDFGIARSGASQMTEVGSIVGTAQYLSPEQARGAPVDQRSDLYSLGIVLYEMLTGKVPFTGEAAVEIAMKHLSAVPDPPSKLRPEISPELDAVVMRALAKDPDQRYSSAEEMDADLARVARGAAVAPQTTEAMTQVLSGAGAATDATVVQHVPPPVPVPPTYRPLPTRAEPRRRRSIWPTLLSLLAIAIAAAGGYLIYHRVRDSLDGSSTVAVVDVGDVEVSNATLLLRQQGLNVAVTRKTSDSVPTGFVISQDPLAGKPVKKKTVVTLTVSAGKPKVPVPSLTGKSEQQALAALKNAGLSARIFKHNSSAPVNTVTATDPATGAVVFEGSTVKLNVSIGPAEVAVPNVLSEPYADAASALRGAGFVPTQSDVNGSAPVDQVTGQNPGAGTLAAPGATVTLTVSKGPRTVSVPNVVGDDQQDAVQLLSEQGFAVSVIHENVSLPTQDGLVLAQSPSHGTLVDGGTVTITVGSLVTPTTPVTPSPPTTPATTPAITPITTPATTTPATQTTATTPATTTPVTRSTTTTTPATTTPGATTTTPSTTPSTTPGATTGAATTPALTTATTTGAATTPALTIATTTTAATAPTSP